MLDIHAFSHLVSQAPQHLKSRTYFRSLCLPTRTIGRDTIKKEIWPGQKLYKWSRTLDVHIQHLRAKLEKNPEEPKYIITAPGVGYMLSNFDSV